MGDVPLVSARWDRARVVRCDQPTPRLSGVSWHMRVSSRQDVCEDDGKVDSWTVSYIIGLGVM